MKTLRVIAIALAILGLRATTHSQAPAPAASRPVFEVASIRQNKSGADGASVRVQPGGRLNVTNNSLRNIVRNAYNVQNFQIVGGPDWFNNDRWDMITKAEGDAAGPQLIVMLRNLLADRFKLAVHTEMRETPVCTRSSWREAMAVWVRSCVPRPWTARRCWPASRRRRKRHQTRSMAAPPAGHGLRQAP